RVCLADLTHRSPSTISTLSLHAALPISYCKQKSDRADKDFLHFISSCSSAMVAGFRTGGWTARKTPSANVIGVRPCLSLRSSFRSEEHTSELQSHLNLLCRLLHEIKHKQ